VASNVPEGLRAAFTYQDGSATDDGHHAPSRERNVQWMCVRSLSWGRNRTRTRRLTHQSTPFSSEFALEVRDAPFVHGLNVYLPDCAFSLGSRDTVGEVNELTSTTYLINSIIEDPTLHAWAVDHPALLKHIVESAPMVSFPVFSVYSPMMAHAAGLHFSVHDARPSHLFYYLEDNPETNPDWVLGYYPMLVVIVGQSYYGFQWLASQRVGGIVAADDRHDFILEVTPVGALDLYVPREPTFT